MYGNVHTNNTNKLPPLFSYLNQLYIHESYVHLVKMNIPISILFFLKRNHPKLFNK